MLDYWSNVAMLAAESQRTIWLRLMKMAGGGVGAHDEAHLMVLEKIKAAVEASNNLANGATASSVILSYREIVRANSCRLSQ